MNKKRKYTECQSKKEKKVTYLHGHIKAYYKYINMTLTV